MILYSKKIKKSQNLYKDYIKQCKEQKFPKEVCEKVNFLQKKWLDGYGNETLKIEKGRITNEKFKLKWCLCIKDIYTYIKEILQYHCVKILNIKEEDFDKHDDNCRRKTDLHLLNNCIVCKLDFEKYKVDFCEMRLIDDFDEKRYQL